MENTKTTSIGLKKWFISFAFAILWLLPVGFATWALADAGLKKDISVYLMALSYPSLLVPTLPQEFKKRILKAGWPARLAFGLPGIAIGIMVLQYSIFQMGHTHFSNTLFLMIFGGVSLILGAFLIVSDVYDD